jgi:hypothetical protein
LESKKSKLNNYAGAPSTWIDNMRYFQLNVTRGFKFPKDAKVVWWHFERRRPWLDLENPEIDVTVFLAGKAVHDVRPRWLDHQGKPLYTEVALKPEFPNERRPKTGSIGQDRRLLRFQVRPTSLHGIALVDEETGFRLLRINPRIIYPDFLFDLLHSQDPRFEYSAVANFVETGTLFGHTALHASHWFQSVFTVELSTELHKQAKKHLAHRKNVRCIKGNSAVILPSLVPTLRGPTMFFLDAHWSGDNSVEWETSQFGGYPVETAKLTDDGLAEPDRQVPLLRELDSIACGHRDRAVVVIDDWQSLGNNNYAFAGEDWSNLDRLQVIEWLEQHPRCLFHHQIDDKRYVWGIEALS